MSSGPQRSVLGKQPPEIEVLLLCASQRPTRPAVDRVTELCRDKAFRWGFLASVARHHEIAPLVLTNALKIGGVTDYAPPKLLDKWNRLKVRNTLAKKRQAHVTSQIIEFFSRRGTRVMLVKGAALDAVIYDEPWFTQSADVDLIVEQRFEELTTEEKSALETIYKRGGTVELEYMRHHDVDMNGVLDIDFARIWKHAIPITFMRRQAYVMSAEDLLLSACVNLCRKRYRLLKGMLAIRDLIGAYPGLDWQTLAGNARAWGAGRIVYGALSMTGEVLGCHVPKGAMDALAVGTLRRATIDALLRRLRVRLLQTSEPQRKGGDRLVPDLLRLTTYSLSQVLREADAHLKLHQFRKLYPRPSAVI